MKVLPPKERKERKNGKEVIKVNNYLTAGQLTALLSQIPADKNVKAVFHTDGFDMQTCGNVSSIELAYSDKDMEIIIHIKENEKALAA